MHSNDMDTHKTNETDSGGNGLLVMLVEDEKAIRDFLSATLRANGYKVIEVGGGREAVSLCASYCPDLILLDLGLPDIDGMEVLDAIREWSLVPIVVVSARNHEKEKVIALDKGADDYVTKPFSNSELLARLRSVQRRSESANIQKSGQEGTFTAGDMVIDFTHRRLLISGTQVHLTPIEYRIITLLSANAGRVLTHEFMLKKLWGPYTTDNQILRVNMANIRRKIEKKPADPKYIQTEIGVGYRMLEPD